MTSKAYQEAYEAHNAALTKFIPIREAYRAGQISDEAYLSAAAEMKLADKAFDVAFAAEAART